MTNDLLNSFKNYFKDEKIVIDNYSLEKGIYFKFNEDGSYERLDILNEKEDKDIGLLYEYFKVRDYYSKYLASNKAVDTIVKETIEDKNYSMDRKICSNNHLTIFFKNRFVSEIAPDGKESIPILLFEKGIEKYYDSLATMGENKREEKIILESIREEISTSDEIYNKKELMLKCFSETIEILKKEKDKLPKDIWIKIFIDSTEKEYEKASNKYLALRIFNKNDRNIDIDNIAYGTNDYNVSLNSNKDFLELKSTSYKAPSLVSIAEIKCIRNMYIWLLKNVANKGYVKIPIDFTFKKDLNNEEEILDKPIYIIKVKNDNGTANIDDFDYIPMYTNKIREFNCKNYLNDDIKINEEVNQDIVKLNVLESFVSKIWFSNYLEKSYDKDNKAIESTTFIPIWKKELLYKYSKLFFDMFCKLEYKGFVEKMDSIAIEIITKTLKEELEDNKTYGSIKSLNLWIALDAYFKRKEMSLEMELKEIKEKSEEIIVNKKEVMQVEDTLYYYIAGQVVRYLLSKSKAAKLTQDTFVPIIEANTIEKLKAEIYYLREKYAHELLVNDSRFNGVFELILLNEPSTSIKEKNNKFALLAGILADNLFYKSMKKDKEQDINE